MLPNTKVYGDLRFRDGEKGFLSSAAVYVRATKAENLETLVKSDPIMDH